MSGPIMWAVCFWCSHVGTMLLMLSCEWYGWQCFIVPLWESLPDSVAQLIYRTPFQHLANGHHSLKTTWVFTGVWGPSSQIAWRQSPFGYRAQLWVNKELDSDRQLLFSLPYFRFCTLVSVLQFPHFSIFHLPLQHKTIQHFDHQLN